MKWFKHISKSRHDKFIQDLNSVYGLAGEHVFWRTIEVLADEFDADHPGECTFFVKTLRKNYDVSWQKVTKIYQTFEKEKKIFHSFIGEGKNQQIRLNCPKLKDLCDNWTKTLLTSH